MEEKRTFQSRGNKVVGSLGPDGRLKFLSAQGVSGDDYSILLVGGDPDGHDVSRHSARCRRGYAA